MWQKQLETTRKVSNGHRFRYPYYLQLDEIRMTNDHRSSDSVIMRN